MAKDISRNLFITGQIKGRWNRGKQNKPDLASLCKIIKFTKSSKEQEIIEKDNRQRPEGTLHKEE